MKSLFEKLVIGGMIAIAGFLAFKIIVHFMGWGSGTVIAFPKIF